MNCAILLLRIPWFCEFGGVLESTSICSHTCENTSPPRRNQEIAAITLMGRGLGREMQH